MTKLKEELNQSYWDDRWLNKQTGWDIGYASTPLVEYFNQIDDKKLRILIPGCGNAYEAEHLVNEGFSNVHVVDISKTAIDNFLTRFPKFPRSQTIHADFFKLDSEYDIIVEQTFFCALHPTLRGAYAKKAWELLGENGKLVGLLFNTIFEHDGPPFGGRKEEYETYFEGLFHPTIMEEATNSIPPRLGRELFINLSKRS